ncbi:MAG: prolyl oligopeptidase family serine peptidase [Aliidongia sp.]
MPSHPLAKALFGIVLLSAGCVQAPSSSQPSAASDSVSDSFFGATITDPYRWLEEPASPRVKAWTDDENQRTAAYLAALPYRAALHERVAGLINGASGSWSGLRACGATLFAIHADPQQQQPVLVALDRRADPDRVRIVLDPNQLDPSGATTFDWYEPSPDGALIAASLSKNGSEDGSVYVFDAKTGRETGEIVPRAQYPTAGGSLAWQADGKGFWYTRYPGEERPEADRHFFQQLYYHRLGTSADRDSYVLGKDFPKVAEIKLDNRYTPGLLLASVLNGDGGEVAHFVLTPHGEAHQVTRFADKVTDAVLGPDGALYLVSRRDAPRGKLLKLAAHDYNLAHAKVIIPESQGAIGPVGQALTLTSDRLYVAYVDGGPSELHAFDHNGAPRGTVPLPPISAVDDMAPLPNRDLLIALSSFTRPPHIVRYSPDHGKVSDTKLLTTSPADFGDAEVTRAFATSKDGTRIPLSIIRRKGTPEDGTAPTLLTGYGGYSIVVSPEFLGATGRVWLDHGGVYVVANIRGGGEYGEDWHRAGNLTRKQNVFDDFAAAARYLIDQHITSPTRLALEGGSNGGLLMGAMITQHPDLARAVVSHVGIYDMLRVELDPNGEFNVTEFGTVKDPEQFKALYAYSPYHHVVDHTAYPAVLMMTGDNDGRVNPMQSRKMTARLQAATGSDRPILLQTRADAGHGIGSARNVVIDQQTDVLAFLFDQLGMEGATH